MVETAQANRRGASVASWVRMLAPFVFGLAFARSGMIAATYGAYRLTDQNLLTDGPMLVALAVLGIWLLVIGVRKFTLPERAVTRLTYASILVEAISAVALGAFDWMTIDGFVLQFALSAVCELSGTLAIFYWLRRARGMSSAPAAAFCFIALAVSEVELGVCAVMPAYAACVVAGLLVLAQFACMMFAEKREVVGKPPVPASEAVSPSRPEDDFFSFGEMAVNSTRLLISIALGIGSLSVVIGFLRGYPNGQAIAFTPVSRVAFAVIAIALCVAVVVLVCRGHERTLTVGIFVAMEALACLALVLYTAFPNALQVGAVCTTVLNALMVGFTWYAIIAFMSHGKLDPYYYAISCWLVWLGFRAVTRIAFLETPLLTGNVSLATAVMAALVVLSAQVVFLQFLGVANEAAEARMLDAEQAAQHAKEEQERLLTRVMGLSEAQGSGPMNLSDMREEAMRRSAQKMGEQYLLSDREVEVLALYALGHTQKRVAEELFISQGTAHAHIKNIYAKTNLHSRQELIDHLRQWC